MLKEQIHKRALILYYKLNDKLRQRLLSLNYSGHAKVQNECQNHD